jgi:site-specific DNA recombinase
MGQILSLRGDTVDKESSNGHQAKRVVLYARISTDEQARSGYSLAQQLEALREHAAREGYEVLEEVVDPGHSGASLARPGMDRVRDLVVASSVSVVLAQDRDRFAREPAYHYLLKKEFEEYGCKMRSLNDRGDDSPEGELTDGILDQLAKFERAKVAERTRRGKLRKAREGKVVATASPDYGFHYTDARDNYTVNEECMRVVRRIFYMIGVENHSLYAVRKALENEGTPAPSGRRTWNVPCIRNIINDDVYKQHTFEETKKLVSSEVANRLESGKLYGIFWFNRVRRTVEQVTETGPNGRLYKRKTKTVHKPRDEWIAIPVPDSGVPRQWVDAAREAIKGNIRTSSAGRKFWELSGGVMKCALCGRAITSNSVARGERQYFYYRCNKRWQDGTCEHEKSHRADRLERLVWDFVSNLLKDPKQLRTGLEQLIERERDGLKEDPNQESKAWANKLSEVSRKRARFQDMAAEGLITFDELRDKIAVLEETRESAQQKLGELEFRRERLAELERDSETLMERYAGMVPDALGTLSPDERHRVYKLLKLGVNLDKDGTLEVSGTFGEGPLFCASKSIPR